MDQSAANHSSILKETREAKGLTLDIVHEATKVPLDALKAIEQGYSVRMLTPFYYRGFIKIYAEFLGLDPQEVFQSYGMPRSTPPGTVVLTPKKTRPAPKENHSNEQFQELLSSILTPKNRALALRLLGVGVAIFLLFRITGCVSERIKNSPKSPDVKTKTKAQAPVVVAEVPASPNGLVRAAAVNHKVELAARAMKDTWIQVKADGKVVFAMTMQKGTMESWSAKDQIELSGKSINTLELEVNGKHIGSLGSNERHAKKVVITREGLTVKK